MLNINAVNKPPAASALYSISLSLVLKFWIYRVIGYRLSAINVSPVIDYRLSPITFSLSIYRLSTITFFVIAPTYDVCMYVCMYVCIYACMHACMYVYVFVVFLACTISQIYTFITSEGLYKYNAEV